MLDLPKPDPEIVPVAKLSARAAGLYVASGDDFQTGAADALECTFEGIAGDLHAGYTRRSGGREPWYPRGTEIRNERQISIVAPDELAEVAGRMGIAEIRPEWIGANMLIDGVPRLSLLPPGTLLFFKGGATLRIAFQNGPCAIAGRVVAEQSGMADREAGALEFAKRAKRLRGVVACVEKPGRIAKGEAISLRIPEQWIYRS
ncbi:MOSC domain-containing protein [Chelativorans sp. M5D2P16]|uniref:MOSC domain-containing protein n=1 Tax=Chelativorans sp. M5D2P16 TaxID=3095678 RepID=UPI002ACA1AB5|nr:molybdenum cofactor sulfurase [Chelativorans sp. M5D2P16]MDZ5698146.1 molybdenum cofactor sulfurase [Chelativorans sp. M5D2P16]